MILYSAARDRDEGKREQLAGEHRPVPRKAKEGERRHAQRRRITRIATAKDQDGRDFRKVER